MARSYSAGKFGRAASAGDAVAVRGFAGLQRALLRIADGAQPEVRMRIKAIGEHVAEVARGNVPHKTGRHGKGPRIEDSLKVSAWQRGASVYTLAPHGGAINVGGQVGRHRATLLKRAEASHYMDRAVQSESAHVEAEVQATLDWLMSTFMEG